MNGYWPCLKILLSVGAEHLPDKHFDETPLHSNSQSIKNHSLLIQTKNKVNCMLYLAAKYGHEECVEILLSNGADSKDRTKSGMTPLHRERLFVGI